MGGDIDTNPGPTLEEVFNQLKDTASDIKEIKEKRLVDIDNKLDALSVLEVELGHCKTQPNSMTRVIQTLEKRIDDLENRSRRSNLIVYGLPEARSETSETLAQAVNNDVIQDKLKLQPIAIERIHRLGKPAPNKTRPVIFKLVDSRQKEAILKMEST